MQNLKDAAKMHLFSRFQFDRYRSIPPSLNDKIPQIKMWRPEMLLNYLYANFFEESVFTVKCDTSAAKLSRLIKNRIFPEPSYIFKSNSNSVSFVSTHREETTYRFHLQGHCAWHDAVERLGLDTEDRARHHFFSRYHNTRETFLASRLGRQLCDVAPDVAAQFDNHLADATWNYFLQGVYGVCTRDGQPESIFLKQAGVKFIEKMIAAGRKALSEQQMHLLKRAVSFLDRVESEFAPHEVSQSSRQRCIMDVRAKFLDTVPPVTGRAAYNTKV